jgi:hypothetical protein
MIRRDGLWACMLLACAAATLFMAWGSGIPALDLAEVSGASPSTCYECKDQPCTDCPVPVRCHFVAGYCVENVRNLSQYCVAKPNGPWQNCKWRVDPKGGCVTTLQNPCVPDNLVCVTPVAQCGPLGTCIPEGVCGHN